MARRKLTKEYVEALLEGFRRAPGNYTRAAAHAGCHKTTAGRAWKNGIRYAPWPEYHEPFRDIIAREQVEARARMATAAEASSRLAIKAEADRRQSVHTEAMKDLTDERVHESQLVRMARDACIIMLNNVTNIAAGAAALGTKVRASLKVYGDNDEPLTLKQAKDVVALTGRLSTALRQCNDAAQKSMEMTRLLLGEPTKILGVQHLESIGIDDAKRRIAAAQRAVDTLEDAGVQQIDGSTRATDPLMN